MFSVLGAIGGAVWSGLGTIATLIVRGIELLIRWTVKLARWIVENPEKGVTLTCLLWAMLTP